MSDKEKIIKGLEHEIARTNIADLEWLDCVEVSLLRDALALLKAQEPIEARLHLCESCTKEYPECDAMIDGIEFGCGVGNDNIIGCTAYVNRWKAQEQDAQRDYETAIEMAEYCERYEPTYDPETGVM